MNLFDYYVPEPALNCPVCNAGLDGWKGVDGPDDLVVWRQGQSQPVEQLAGSESPLAAEALAALRLPNVFRIYTSCCSKRFFVEAIGRAPNGTWKSTELISADNAQRDKNERMEDFKSRIRWLQGGHR
ncbi:MAG: hypothetical protein V4729_07720 [Pseudomonadota bacterium]